MPKVNIVIKDKEDLLGRQIKGNAVTKQNLKNLPSRSKMEGMKRLAKSLKSPKSPKRGQKVVVKNMPPLFTV